MVPDTAILGIIEDMDFFEGVVALESTPASERIELFGDQVRELLHPTVTEDARLVQKGLMLYRQGLVKQIQIWNEQDYGDGPGCDSVLCEVEF